MNHVCANDKQYLMNVQLIRANREKQIVALTSTQSMLRAIKHYVDFLSRNFAVNKVDLRSTVKVFQLKPVIDFPTRGVNTLDQIYTNLSQYYSSPLGYPPPPLWPIRPPVNYYVSQQKEENE